MGKSLNLFRIRGIPIGLHPSWFVIFLFLTWSLASGYFAEGSFDLPFGGIWILGLITSLLFFGSVLAHELGHAFVALRNNIPVKSISLFFLGGVAEIKREPDSPGEEFRIALAGPMVSLALAVVFNSLAQFSGELPYLAAAFSYLGRVNLLLGVFNMIPGFPMDGGRILRAAIWKVTGNHYQATQVASFTGRLVAFGFIAFGVFSVFSGNLGNGIWMGFIGLFLLNLAGSASAQAKVQQKLDGIRVEQVMSRNYPSVPGETTLEQLVMATLSDNTQGTYLVLQDDQPAGILSLGEITKVPRNLWSRTQAKEVMKSFEKTVQISPDTPVLAALQEMESENLRLVPVVDGLNVLGVLSRERVLNYLRLRTELGS
jgi:Zn-dependent protease/predicted transcriptional regulator